MNHQKSIHKGYEVLIGPKAESSFTRDNELSDNEPTKEYNQEKIIRENKISRRQVFSPPWEPLPPKSNKLND